LPRQLAYKAGVRITQRTVALDVLENGALHTQEELGYPEVLFITSINDSGHGTPSKHWRELAVDLRTKGPRRNDMGSTKRKQRFRQRWEENCGSRFRIILEKLGTDDEHLHGQVRKGLEEHP
jgi:hypothetical protein